MRIRKFMQSTYARPRPLTRETLILLLTALACSLLHAQPPKDKPPPAFRDDASRLNRTRVAEVVDIPGDPVAAEAQLRALLKQARTQGLKVSIAGAKHTMGGHTIAADGISVNMLPFHRLELDVKARIL